ncbi:MAG: hypothetical protein JWP39_3712 [Jatrophihabitans sp.]|nr:hypothetical protein [Jatrophihabitans sp.]
MIWIPIGAWIAAAVIAVVLLGFCTYEIVWKTKRLRADLVELQAVADQLQDLRGELVVTQERLAATGLR